MASDIGFYTPLRTIVAYALDEENKSMGDQDRMWVLGLRGLTMMNFDISAQPKTVRLPVSANKTVPFPADLISWSKIGVLDSEGQISTLRINNSLTTFRDNNPNRLSQLTPDITAPVIAQPTFPYYANFYYNGGLYQLFGLGNGVITYGDCKVDEGNRVIILSPDFKYDSIMIEYVSSPQKDVDYQVQTCLQEAIIMFIRWKMKLAKREEFFAEAIAARRRLNNKKVILQTLNQVLRESNGMKLRS